MIRSRSLPNIGSFPTDPIDIECKECGRHGRYSKAALIKQYGDDVVLPDLLAAISRLNIGLSRWRGSFASGALSVWLMILSPAK